MMTTAEQIGAAVSAKKQMALATEEVKNRGLLAMAQALRDQCSLILEANAQDLAASSQVISPVMLDRLRLDKERVEAMAKGVEQVATLPDPVGRSLSQSTAPNGLHLEKIACSMGVIAIIYESRPNVTSDAAALALKAGSACLLRAGKEAHHTAKAIVDALHQGMAQVGLAQEALVLVEDTSRDSATALMKAKGQVDLLIPRGGKGLISACVEQAIVPVLETGTGICHGYVDKDADLAMALSIVVNGKTSRPSVCNAMEVCLVHSAVAKQFLTMLLDEFEANAQKPGGHAVEIRLKPESLPYCEGRDLVLAKPEDFDTEFLDYILAVAVVDSMEEATAHISAHSTGHSEVIITENPDTAKGFTQVVDAAAVYVNASTRFTDGGEFGLGCEMGISTQKLHARGPLGLEELCSYKFVITGTGQIR